MSTRTLVLILQSSGLIIPLSLKSLLDRSTGENGRDGNNGLEGVGFYPIKTVSSPGVTVA